MMKLLLLQKMIMNKDVSEYDYKTITFKRRIIIAIFICDGYSNEQRHL